VFSRAVLAGAWLVLVVYAFPGEITQDSIDHLTEARSGFYTDAHPPFISLLWGVLDKIVAGPILMLLLQSGLLLAGLYVILRRIFEERRASWATAAVFLFPPVLLPMAVIWKDCLMAGGLALGAGLLLSERRAIRVAALAPLWFATAVRYNAFAATFALVVLLFEWTPCLRWWKRYAISVGVWLAMTLSALGLNQALTDREMHYWQSSIAVHDIAGTLTRVEPLSDPQVAELLDGTGVVPTDHLQERMRDVYSAHNFVGLIAGPKALWSLPTGGIVPPTHERLDAIARAWERVVTRYPLAYAKHRLRVFAGVLELGSRRAVALVPSREPRWPQVAKDLGLPVSAPAFQQSLTRAAAWIARHVPIFAPWMYLLLALVLLVVGRKQRDVLALLLSGIGLEASLVLLAPSDDYRYSHWMIVTVIVSTILVITRRARAKR
jgi:hypothetical protein